MVSILLAISLFLGVCHGVPGASDRRPTSIQSYPSLVQVERFDPLYSSTWGMFCAGNIVSSNVILSAAHCFHGAYDEFYYPEFRRIRAGTSYRNRGGVILTIAGVLIHPYFHNEPHNVYADLTIIRLRDNLVFGSTINSISIIPANFEIPINSGAVQVGWGYDPSNVDSDVVREMLVWTLSYEVCTERYGEINEDSICATVSNASIDEGCPGDYGGPLYYGGVLAGIYSWGSCGDPVHAGVSTKVSDYTEWIVANTA